MYGSQWAILTKNTFLVPKELYKMSAKERQKIILLGSFALHAKATGKHSGRRVQCRDTDFDVNFFLSPYVIINLY